MSVSLMAGRDRTDQITAGAVHCAFCFDMIQCKLYNTERAAWDLPFATQKFPIFVTWHIWRRSNWELRGCIGTFSRNIRILDGLEKYSCVSAFQDSRFKPIAAHEVENLRCGVSFLHTFTPASDWNDWVIGQHGITIDFEDANGTSYSATYLPEVSIQQGWDHAKTFSSLARKAGYKSSNLKGILNLRVTRYESTKFNLTYAEFCEMYASMTTPSPAAVMGVPSSTILTSRRSSLSERDRERNRDRRMSHSDDEREREDRDSRDRLSSPNTLATASALSSLLDSSLAVGDRNACVCADGSASSNWKEDSASASASSLSSVSCSKCGGVRFVDARNLGDSANAEIEWTSRGGKNCREEARRENTLDDDSSQPPVSARSN